MILAPFIKKKVQTKKTNHTKVKVQIRGEKERNVQSRLSASESSSEEGHGPGNLMTCVQASLIPLVQLLNGVARDILHRWRQFLWICPTIRHTLFWILAVHDHLDQERQSEDSRNVVFWHYKRILLCNKSFVFTNSESETCWENCIIHFLRNPVMCPSCFPFLRGKIWVRLLSWIRRGDKITWPAFGLYSSPAEDSTVGHVVLDVTGLAHQPKSRERPTHPKRHVTFVLTVKNAWIQFTHQNLEKIQPEPRTELIKEKRELVAERSMPTPLRKRKGNPVWRDPSATMEPDVSRNSRERSEEDPNHQWFVGWAKFEKPSSEASTCQFQKRTTYLDHVVKTCPFCNSTKPRPDRSRVSGLRTEECGDLNFLDHGSGKIGDKNLSISDCFAWRDITFWQHIHARVPLHRKSFPNFMNGGTLFRWIQRRFHHPHGVQTFYRMHNVKRLPTGPHAPWPNRAEMRIRLFNNFLSLHLWIQPLKIWTRPLCHRLHLPTKKAESFSPQQLQGFGLNWR